MTLTEFLLARIGEDEDVARADSADAMVGWRWKHFPAEAYEVIQAATLAHAKRTLAECEVKRQILRQWQENDELHNQPGFHYRNQTFGQVVRTLTQPYADHPDYRDRWAL